MESFMGLKNKKIILCLFFISSFCYGSFQSLTDEELTRCVDFINKDLIDMQQYDFQLDLHKRLAIAILESFVSNHLNVSFI